MINVDRLSFVAGRIHPNRKGGESSMAAYEWAELEQLWAQERLSETQMLGQLLQWGRQNHTATLQVQRQVEALTQVVAALTQRVTLLETRPRRRDG